MKSYYKSFSVLLVLCSKCEIIKLEGTPKKRKFGETQKDSSKNCQYGNIGFGQTSDPSKIGQASLL